MAETDGVLEAIISAQLAERNAARVAEGRGPFTAAEEEAVRKSVADLLNSEGPRRMAQLLKEGAGDDFKKMAAMSGAPGALPLMHAIIDNCPGLTARRRVALKKRLRMPFDLRLGPGNRCSGLKLTFPGNDPSPGGETPPVKFMIHCNSASAEHDLGAELARVEPYASEADMARVREQAGQLLNLARQAYARMLGDNDGVLREMREKMKALEGFDPTALHIDDSNTTFYLAHGDQKWEPRCGIYIERLS